MKKYLFFPVMAIVLALVAHLSCSLAQPRQRVAVLPETATFFSSTRSVTNLVVDSDGTLWASTSGGVLRRSSDGGWTKFSRRDGLPSNEARKIGMIALG